MNSITLTQKDIDRFWSKVDVRTPDECWEWKGADNGRGYGKFYVGGEKMRYRYAHRISWMLKHGNIKGNLQVLHRCDNPRCVNCNHLFLGTASDNMKDCSRKGRMKGGFCEIHGENHHSAKLKEKDIPVIRSMIKKGISMTDVSKKYKVSLSTIYHIKIGRSWSWVK